MKSFNLENYINKPKKKQLDIYIDILKKWQKSINLISNDTVGDIWNRHIIDSVQLIKYIDKIKHDSNLLSPMNICDLGTGAGFPGLVLSICNEENRYYLIESNGKKSTFLKEVIRTLDLNNVLVINKRIEAFAEENIQADIVTSRGLASLPVLVNLSKQLLKSTGAGLFLKGKKYQEELTLLKQLENFPNLMVEEFPSLVDPLGRVLIINNLII